MGTLADRVLKVDGLMDTVGRVSLLTHQIASKQG